MSEDRDQLLAVVFSQAQELERVESASGGFVPLPPVGNRQGEYLFINCVYEVEDVLSVAEKVRLFRHDAERVVALATGACGDALAVCVSFYEIPQPGSNLRLYRTSVESDRLAAVGTVDFRLVAKGEESSCKDVHAFLLDDRQGL